MKIPVLEAYEDMNAMGILARAAIALTDEDNPAATLAFPGEAAVRAEVIDTVRRSLGINSATLRGDEIEKIIAVLDGESDRLLGPIDLDGVAEARGDRGELPSDRYLVAVDADFLAALGPRLKDERRLIEQAVRRAQGVQHFFPADGDAPGAPRLSLFCHYFENRDRDREFTMLVVGKRKGLQLAVAQGWRIYPGFNARGARTLMDLLERFARRYGTRLDARANGHTQTAGRRTVLCQIDRRRDDGSRIAIDTYAIDLRRYRKTLALHDIKSERMAQWKFPVGAWGRTPHPSAASLSLPPARLTSNDPSTAARPAPSRRARPAPG